jgi:Zn-dependent peptidase ImmA (M78 family)
MNKAAALEWMACHQVPLNDQKDMRTMCKRLDIRLRHSKMTSTLFGLFMWDIRPQDQLRHVMVINSLLLPKARLFTFGHEMGHYFCFTRGIKNQGGWGPRQKPLEDFCDWFSTELTGQLEPEKKILQSLKAL